MKACRDFLLSVAVLLCSFQLQVNADRTGAYRNSQYALEDNSDWMSELPDTALLSDLSLPGTHDSAAYKFGGETTETQGMNIEQQLKAGIRALDIRLGVNHLNVNVQCKGPTLWTFHGISCQFQKFTDVLTTVETFLLNHPDEVIVMRVRKENGDIPDFATRVESDMDTYAGLFYQQEGNPNPSLVEIRGQVVLLRDYGGSSRGISWPSLFIQDRYYIQSNWHLARKWNAVRNHFIDADNASNNIYVNFLSAAGGSFPYFVASGKSSWETYAPALLTGWTEGYWPFNSCGTNNDCIEEYYRTNCAFRVCSVAFKGINLMAREYIASSVQLKTGIVMADFPGPNLIGAIIDINVFI